MARKCLFCEGIPNSGEHLFPDWLNKVMTVEPTEESPKWERRIGDAEGFRSNAWSAKEIANLTANYVCKLKCNEGWMSTLEGRAKPLLTPMINGNPQTLNQEQQIVVATWATKTVMVIEPTLSQEGNFSQADRKIVMEHDRPPASVRVFAAIVEGGIPPIQCPMARLHYEEDGSRIYDLHLQTLQIGTLVLQVMRIDPPPDDYGILAPIKIFNDFEVPVFPPATEFFWPPKLSLNLESLEKYARRELVASPPGWMRLPPKD